jgi:hypothetical protein
MKLTDMRRELVDAERYSYDPSYFPGSNGWRVNQAARAALAAFDAAYPEVAAEAAAVKDQANQARIAAAMGQALSM